MPTVDIYSKQQVDALIPSANQLVPSTSGASSGDVLTFDGSNVGWAAGGGGGGATVTSYDLSINDDRTNFFNALKNIKVGDEVLVQAQYNANGSSTQSLRASIKPIFAISDNLYCVVNGTCKRSDISNYFTTDACTINTASTLTYLDIG